jgi:hypothetical protein
MKNTILKYEKEELDEFISCDYFSKNINIWDSFNEFKEYLITYKIDNGDKLERISYELYGTSDYWDILLLINDRTPLYDMPYDFEILSGNAIKSVNYYKDYIYDNAPLAQDRVDEFYSELIEDGVQQNELHRYIYVVKRSRLNDFISLMKKKGFI